MRDAGAQVRPDHATARRSEGDAPSRCLGNGRKRSISAAPLQNTRQTDLVGSLGLKSDRLLDALEQALHARRGPASRSLIHHSDRGSQYVSIRYTERLADAGIEPSVGSVGDSYDNALAETINGLYKAEVIHRRSWRNLQDVELATLEWVDWFNHKRLLGPIGDIPPAEAEANYHQQIRELAMAA